MFALGPTNPYIAAEINSSNSTTLNSVPTFAPVSFRSTTPSSFLIQSGETDMIRAFIAIVVAIPVLWASNTNAQTAEPAAKLVVDPPLAEPLSRGVAFINYRTENLQVVPVFGSQALNVSPRIGHLHVAVDGAQWLWADTRGGAIIIAGLPPWPAKAYYPPVNANHS